MAKYIHSDAFLNPKPGGPALSSESEGASPSLIRKPAVPGLRPCLRISQFRRFVCRKPGEIMHAGPMQHQAEQRGMGSSWSCRSLRHYEGPQCFAIPGNHDWIDGLETFMRHITCKGWLGGWMMPQEKSYFALHLPQGW